MERQTAGPGLPSRITTLRWLVALVALLGAAWIVAPAADGGSPDATVAVEIVAPSLVVRRRRSIVSRWSRRGRPVAVRPSRSDAVAAPSTPLVGGPAPPRGPPTR